LPWDGFFTEWDTFDLVVLRSCWNYHLQPEEFKQWLNELEKQNVKLLNPLSIIRWNMHKGYLQELSNQGVAVPETKWLTKGAKTNLAELMKAENWNKVVVKPAISATAFNTLLIANQEAEQNQERFISLLSDYDLLVQKFMPEVTTQGEWSLLFFNKQFSHGVLKKPKSDDFRVQNDFGGTAERTEVPLFVREQAEQWLKLIKEPLLYTRVDGVVSNGKFVLMELELIEPVLFLKEDEQAPVRFANEIVKLLK